METPPFSPARLMTPVYLLVASALAGAGALTSLLYAHPDWFLALVQPPTVWVLVVLWIALSTVLGSDWKPPTIALSAVTLALTMALSSVLFTGALWAFEHDSLVRAFGAAAAVFVIASVIGPFIQFDFLLLRRRLGSLSTLFVVLVTAIESAILGGIATAISVALACATIASTAQSLRDEGLVTRKEELSLRIAQLSASTYFRLVDVITLAAMVLGKLKRRRS